MGYNASSDRIFFALRRLVESGNPFSRSDLSRWVLVQLCQPGRPGDGLTPKIRAKLAVMIDQRVEEIVDPTDYRSLRRLAEDVINLVEVFHARTLSGQAKRAVLRGDSTLVAQAALLTEKTGARSDHDWLQKATTRAWRQNRRAWAQKRKLPIGDGDPLREVFRLEEAGNVNLDKDDMKVHLFNAMAGARGKGKKTLLDTLRSAACFEADRLREALGETLWVLGQPFGFADRHGRILLVAVASSAAAQELNFQKAEFLDRVQQIPGLEKIRDMRYEIRASGTMKVVGRESIKRS